MAAGQGFKTFVTGEVLTAGDVNGYLMQGINVFASTAARDAAITAPAEGQFAFTKDTNGLWYYDGAAWVASGATGDIEGVTAGIGISGGGTSGTVTITNSMATAIDAKGDLVAGTGADTFSRLAIGSNDTVLTADSTAATGMKWASAPSPNYTFSTYTPTITQSGSVSFTVGQSRYVQIGKMVFWEFYLSVSGSGTANNIILITTPLPVTNGGTIKGSGYLWDNSAALMYPFHTYAGYSSPSRFYMVSSYTQLRNGFGDSSSNFTAALAADDQIRGFMIYETD